MYFQVCSNSTYPQHSGEQYTTNGPLVTLVTEFQSASQPLKILIYYTLCYQAKPVTNYLVKISSYKAT